jgi:hypothetical protein
MIEELLNSGYAVLALDQHSVAQRGAAFSPRTLLAHISTGLITIGKQAGIDQERIGLFGLGLGADAVQAVAFSDAQTKTVVAVSPFSHLGGTSQMKKPGLDWLRELGYRRAWSLRRHCPAILRAAADFGTWSTRKGSDPVCTATVLGVELKTAAEDQHAVSEIFAAPNERFFALLEDRDARKLIIEWLNDKL